MIVREDAAATVVITTRNRREDLMRALASCEAQTVPLEVIVVDDASDDGTPAAVNATWPDVELIAHVERRGYIHGRNEAAFAAATPYLFSIDDDAEYSAPGTVEKALACFDHPRVAGLSMPHVNVGSGAPATSPPPDDDRVWVSYAYVGTSHALRRDLFLQYGPYDESFVHQGEEIELCEKLRAGGYVIRLVDTPPILHYESAQRDVARQDTYGARNALLIGWRYAPRAALPAWTARAIGKSLLVAIQRGHGNPARVLSVIRGVVQAVASLRHQPRHPVGASQWELSLQLRRYGPLPLASVEPRLVELERRSEAPTGIEPV